MLKKLRIGVMKSQELADWFGISYNTFRKNTQARLQLLKFYCRFKKVWGGVQIFEIYKECYNKDLTPKLKKYLENILHKTNNGLSTFSGMARKIMSDKGLGKDKFDAIYEQCKYYGNKGFGTLRRKDQKNESHGFLGSKKYVWAVRDGWYNEYRELNEDEWKIFDQCIDQTKKIFNIIQIIQQNDLLKNQQIDLKQYAEENFMTTYDSNIYFKNLFEEKTGLPLDYVQKHKVNQEWIKWEEKVNETSNESF